jgi:subtilisin family serine protease
MSSDLVEKLLQLQIPVVIMPAQEATMAANPINPSHQRYIIAFNNDIDPVSKSQKLDNIPGFKSKHVMKHAINGCTATINRNLMAQLIDDSEILYIEKDALVQEMMYSKEELPDERTRATALWHQTMTKTEPLTTDNFSNVHCYVVDSGIFPTHTEFTASQVFLDFNAITKNTRAQDDNGHGTAVASIVGGKTVGISNRTILHSIKVLDSTGNGYVSDIVSGLNWIIANKKRPCVINISLGGTFSSSLNSAVQNCINAGIPVVCAAGNSGIDASTTSPANTVGAVTVSCHDLQKTRPTWGNYGSVVSSFAPGVSVKSAWSDSNSSYFLVSGTSFSSPIVTGIICRYLKEKPNATPSDIASFLSRCNLNNEIVNPGSITTPNKRLIWDISKINPC